MATLFTYKYISSFTQRPSYVRISTHHHGRPGIITAGGGGEHFANLMYFEILYHRQSQYTDLKTRNGGEVLHENYRYLFRGSASVLPVGHVEPAVAEACPSGGSWVVLHIVSVGGSGRSSDGVVSIKVDTNLERCRPGAGSGMSSSHRPSEEDPADPVVAEGPGGPDGGLEGGDVKIVSQTFSVSDCSGECGHSCA